MLIFVKAPNISNPYVNRAEAQVSEASVTSALVVAVPLLMVVAAVAQLPK